MKIVWILFAFFGLLFAEGESKKVVLDLTTGDIGTFKQKVLGGIVSHKTHYQNALEELDVAVIIHGDSYKFFLKDIASSKYRSDRVLLKAYPELKKRIASLVENYDVEFLICNSGMKKHGIALEKVDSFVKTVPNAGIGLIDKQNDGYAYIPVGD